MSINVTPIPRLIDLAVPAFTLGTTNAAGSAETAIASNSTLAVFDSTVPTTIAYDASAATGSATVASRRDHTHGMVSAPSVATQAQMEAASSTTVYVTPGRTQYHPGVTKAWCHGTDGNLVSSYNISGISNDSDGINTYTIATDLSSTTYPVVTGTDGIVSNNSRCIYSGSRAAGSFKLLSSNDGVASGLTQFAAVLGDQ
tara:strand:+ start:79 stop:678 length:600 start_codon:yes stop_codon:yes gene_type:complete